MDLHRYLRAIRRSWWIVVVVAILGAVVGYGLAARSPKVYAATVTFYVATPRIDATTAYGSDQFAQDRANSYARLLSSQRFASLVARQPGIDLAGNDIAAKISGTAQVDTVLVDARIVDTSLPRLRDLQHAVADEFPVLVGEIETTNTVALRVVSTPPVSAAPIAPRTAINVIIGFAVGLVLGLLVAALRELIDTSVRSGIELEELAGVPLIGSIASDPSTRWAPVVTSEGGYSRRAEDFRQLRTNLEFVHTAKSARALAVTSSIAGEGKSSTSLNIAATAAERGAKVLLIDADLRRPQIADYLGFDGVVGLTTVLTRRVDTATAVRPWGEYGLEVLPSGQTPPNPSELLNSDGMRELMDELREQYDLIVVDTPPVLAVTDAAVCSTIVDGVVVLYRYGKTRRANLVGALHALRAVDARIVGVVMNMRPRRGVDGEQYGSYGSYESLTGRRKTAGGRGMRRRDRPRVPNRRRDHSRPSDPPPAEPAAATTTPVAEVPAGATARSTARYPKRVEEPLTLASIADSRTADEPAPPSDDALEPHRPADHEVELPFADEPQSRTDRDEATTDGADDDAPSDDAPSDDAPSDDVVADDAEADEVAGDDVVADEVVADADADADDAVADEVVAGDAQAGDAVADEVVADDAVAGDAQAEDAVADGPATDRTAPNGAPGGAKYRTPSSPVADTRRQRQRERGRRKRHPSPQSQSQAASRRDSD